MEMPRLLVVHDSEQIRETVAILLESYGKVEGYPPDAVRQAPTLAQGAKLLILQGNATPEVVRALPADSTVLWLLDAQQTAAPTWSGRAATLPAAFAPAELCAQVQELLADRKGIGAGQPHPTDIAYPLVSEDAAKLLGKAKEFDLPVLVCGEPGSGKARVVQAIAAAQPWRTLYVLGPSSGLEFILKAIAADEAPQATLHIRDVLAVNSDDVGRLCDLLDQGGFQTPKGWKSVRVLCGSSVAYESLCKSSGLSASLFYRLGGITIDLESLRLRSNEIPAIAQAVVSRLSKAVQRPVVTLSEAALRRMQRYLWFGNLAELETVLLRSLLLLEPNDRPVLGAEDLRFAHARSQPARRNVDNTQPAHEALVEDRNNGARHIAEPSHTAELIIQELAHELKNPLVAIKTMSQQLGQLTSNEHRQQIAKLAGEAADRMDQTIDNLLQFSHFGDPYRTHVALNGVLASALGAAKSTASERGVKLEYTPPAPQLVHVDPAQIHYALENILRALIRDVDAGNSISIRSASDRNTILIECQKGGIQISERLRAMIDSPNNGTANSEPLGFVFARSLVERNAGRVDVTTNGNTRTVAVYLPGERNNLS